MEARNRAAGHGDEQNGEHGAQLLVVEAGEHRQVHGRMGHQQAHGRTGDHADEHKGGHVITGLLHQPHGQHRGKEDVHEGDVAPGRLAQHQREVCAHHEGQHDERDAQHRFLPAGEVVLFLDQAEHHGEHHEHDGHHARRAVGLGRGGKAGHAVRHRVGVEGAGHHVGKGGDDNAAEQPAEQQEQLAAQLADVFLDQQAHGFALVLHRGVQGAEVRHGAEEDAAQKHPQQHGQPAKGGGLNGAGHRAGTGNGAELVAEHRPAVGGHIVLAVLMGVGRGFGGGIDAPFVGEPPAVQRVAAQQAHCRDQNDNERVHTILPLSGVSAPPVPTNKTNRPPGQCPRQIFIRRWRFTAMPSAGRHRQGRPAGVKKRPRLGVPPGFARAGPLPKTKAFKRRRANGPVRRNSASAVPLRLPPFCRRPLCRAHARKGPGCAAR